MAILLEKSYRRHRVYEVQMEAAETSVDIEIWEDGPPSEDTLPLWTVVQVKDSSGVIKAPAGLTITYDETTGVLTVAEGGAFTFAADDTLTVLCAFYTSEV